VVKSLSQLHKIYKPDQGIHVCSCYAGQSLQEAGESFKRLGEVKYSLEENVKQNFLEPLSHLQTKDLKEVNVSPPDITRNIDYHNPL